MHQLKQLQPNKRVLRRLGDLGWLWLLSVALYGCAATQPQSALAHSPEVLATQTIPLTTTLWLPLVLADANPPAAVTALNGSLRLRLFWGTDPAAPLSYTVDDATGLIIAESPLALQLPANEQPLGQLMLTQVAHKAVDQRYPVNFGEAAAVHDQYNEMIAHFQERAGLARTLQLIVRVYDTAVAFRYHIPGQPAWSTVTLLDEASHVVFPTDYLAYVQHGTEGEYQPQPLSAITGHSETPLTLVGNQGRYLAITEAAVENYPRMVLTRQGTAPPTLVTSLESPVQATTPFTTPWRVLMSGSSPAALLAQSDLLYKLSPATTYTDTTWIRPGQAMRSQLNTQAALDTIDFATALGIEYVEFDAGWYGLGYDGEFDPNSDATQVIDAIDMPQVIAYATQQGRGLILYVNRVALERQLDELLPLYASWGVQGIKLGFMDGRSQAGIRLIHDIVRKAAAYHMVVDVHDNYRPSGLSRTYPNLLTQEGVRGNEHFSNATHNVTLPFTRFLAGAADYTFPYFTSRLSVTRAHQLGAMIAFFSPLQFVFWYESPSHAQGEPELALIGAMPTVWDETRVLQGEIGATITIARRKGQAWYVGILTDLQARTVTIPLTFLDPGQSYTATQYSDQTPRQVAVQSRTVTATDTLTATLLPSGGHVIQLLPMGTP